MNYNQLEKKLNSSFAYSNKSDQEILDHFMDKFSVVPNENDVVFIFEENREFKNKNHLISLHERCNGKVPMHIFHYIVMTYVYSGTFTIHVENSTHILNKGDIIIFDKYVPHSVEATGKDDLGINIILHPHFFSNKFISSSSKNHVLTKFLLELANNRHPHIHYLLYHTGQDNLIHTSVQNIMCEYLDPQVSSEEIIDNYIMILLAYLTRKQSYKTNLSISNFKNKQVLVDVLHYISNHYKDGNLTNMCQKLGYNPSYMSNLIKKYLGKNFKELVNEERMKRAIILLQNDDFAIYEIAEMIGISNLTTFYKYFKDYAHCTPKEYRDKSK